MLRCAWEGTETGVGMSGGEHTWMSAEVCAWECTETGAEVNVGGDSYNLENLHLFQFSKL